MKYEPRRIELCHARPVCYGLNLAGGSQTRSPAKTRTYRLLVHARLTAHARLSPACKWLARARPRVGDG